MCRESISGVPSNLEKSQKVSKTKLFWPFLSLGVSKTLQQPSAGFYFNSRSLFLKTSHTKGCSLQTGLKLVFFQLDLIQSKSRKFQTLKSSKVEQREREIEVEEEKCVLNLFSKRERERERERERRPNE